MELNAHRLEELEGLSLDKACDYMELHCEKHMVGCVDWPAVASYQPICAFTIAYGAKHIYVAFTTTGQDLRATNTANLSAVSQDSCVEFFMQVPGSKEYWNFEFNCIGAVNASHRETRPCPVRLNDEQIESIERYSSVGYEPFAERGGLHTWRLAVAIPFALIGIGPDTPYIMGNFYKCADKTAHPHYLSWAPIHMEKPNFHCPEFFGRINLL
jgi:hypothetical protein